MRARRAEFVTAASQASSFPPPELPEIAFAGRSNVGKSSLINALVGVAGLARTSRTPGRTRLLNWFRIEPPRGRPVAFVDLPGYGYAKVPRALRESWRPLIESYLEGRAALRAVVLIIDARRGVGPEDQELVVWLGEQSVPVLPVVTKVDKLAKAQHKLVAAAAERELGLSRPPVLFSAPKKQGIEELWREIGRAVAP